MDYYSVLEIDRNCSSVEIKNQYKKLSKIYHPDKNEKNKNLYEKIFKQIYEANKILSNLEKRKEYDKFLNKFSKQENSNNNISLSNKQVNLLEFSYSMQKLWNVNILEYIYENINHIDKKLINLLFENVPNDYKDIVEKIKTKFYNIEKIKEYSINVSIKDYYLKKSQKVVIKKKGEKIVISVPLKDKIYIPEDHPNICIKINLVKYKNFDVVNNDIILKKYITIEEIVQNKGIDIVHLDDRKFKLKLSDIDNDNQIVIKNEGLSYGNEKKSDLIIKLNVIISNNILDEIYNL